MNDDPQITVTRSNASDVVDFINRPDEHQHAYTTDSGPEGVVVVATGEGTFYLHAGSTVTRTDTEFVVVRAGDREPCDRFPRVTTPMYLEALRGKASAHQQRAATSGRRWTDWADQLQQLVDQMPPVERAVTYLDGDQEDSAHPLGVDHIDPTDLKATLTRVRAAADSVSGAYRRAVRSIEARQTETLRGLAGDLGRPDLA